MCVWLGQAKQNNFKFLFFFLFSFVLLVFQPFPCPSVYLFVPIIVVYFLDSSSSFCYSVFSCFLSSFLCFIFNVCCFSASSADISLSLSVQQLFYPCHFSFSSLFCSKILIFHFMFFLPLLLLFLFICCPSFSCSSCCHFAEFLYFTSSALLFIGPPPQQFVLFGKLKSGPVFSPALRD